jgi:acetyl esterase/lipase
MDDAICFRRLFAFLVLAGISATTAAAAELTPGEQAFQTALGRKCQVITLWPPGKIPDEVKPLGAEQVGLNQGRPFTMLVRNVSQPSFTIASPPVDKNTGVALVLCHGRGYGSMAIETVVASARWFNARGVTVVWLKYRVPKRNRGLLMYHHALQDAQRAVGILRARAVEWKIDPEKIGVGGFSAGGHLAATIANGHEPRLYQTVDDSDKVSCRPDFTVLVNPAYLTDPVLSRKLTPHLQVGRLSPKKTPPTFTAITTQDRFTSGAVEYALALRQAKVNHELHIYASSGQEGAHDKNRLGGDTIGHWVDECHRWLGDLKLVPATPQPDPLTYLAANLPDIEPAKNLTLGDARLRQILGHDAPVIPLWPAGEEPDEIRAAGPETVTHRSRGGQALNITNVTRPTLTLITPAAVGRSRRAVIVCPGGAYRGLAAEHEGTRVAQWFNELGITALLLKYRVPRRGGEFAKHHHALQDLQRAMRIVRSRSSEWGIDPQQIGVCGFSAGGHLCATMATSVRIESYPPIDEIDKQSARPDFALLVYPAYLTDPIDSDTIAAVARGSQPSGLTPPLFMTVAADDRFARGVLNFYLDVRQAKVDVECHVYAAGGHGGGLDPVSYPSSEWTRAATQWLVRLPNDKSGQ